MPRGVDRPDAPTTCGEFDVRALTSTWGLTPADAGRKESVPPPEDVRADLVSGRVPAELLVHG